MSTLWKGPPGPLLKCRHSGHTLWLLNYPLLICPLLLSLMLKSGPLLKCPLLTCPPPVRSNDTRMKLIEQTGKDSSQLLALAEAHERAGRGAKELHRTGLDTVYTVREVSILTTEHATPDQDTIKESIQGLAPSTSSSATFASRMVTAPMTADTMA